jgi:hypothetical protein
LFTKRTFAIIRHLTPDAIQKEVKVGQLTSFKDLQDSKKKRKIIYKANSIFVNPTLLTAFSG